MDTNSDHGRFSWPEAEHSTRAELACPLGPVNSGVQGIAHRWCNVSTLTEAISWDDPDYTECKTVSISKVEPSHTT